ncbi:translation initiation factor Sui1 [Candidatus Magnetaquicoccus inordinatus]|uniref:translation initiation factor Sui1 n=1 Tax=Candidatus Magnetaquicoccus inordinatus TaxID=2496818 RepID=UPI00102C166D|nr:translation initiation factor Sui1 [Candidatus Magnetaquicoccus inordinatus]
MNERVVFSTEQGRMCPECQQPLSGCICRQTKSVAAAGGLRVLRERKGRQGKDVTVIHGLSLDPLSLAQLGKELRSACATGGTVKEGTIELQGDHVQMIISLLSKKGWSVKRSGG